MHESSLVQKVFISFLRCFQWFHPSFISVTLILSCSLFSSVYANYASEDDTFYVPVVDQVDYGHGHVGVTASDIVIEENSNDSAHDAEVVSKKVENSEVAIENVESSGAKTDNKTEDESAVLVGGVFIIPIALIPGQELDQEKLKNFLDNFRQKNLSPSELKYPVELLGHEGKPTNDFYKVSISSDGKEVILEQSPFDSSTFVDFHRDDHGVKDENDFPSSNDGSVVLGKIAEYYGFSESGDFFTVSGALVGGQLSKKSGSKIIKNLAFSGNLKKSFYPGETGKFLKRNGFELIRNFPAVIGDGYNDRNLTKDYVKTEVDYQREGQIIRNSLIDHFVMSVVVVGYSHYIPGGIGLLGLPDDAVKLVDSYLNPADIPFLGRVGFTLMEELSGDTADKILALERSGWRWAPEAFKAGITCLVFLAQGGSNSPNVFKSLVIAEGVSSTVVGGATVAALCLDPAYAEYGVCSTEGGLIDFGIQKDLLASGFPVLVENLVGTLGELLKFSLDLISITGDDEDAVRNMMSVIKAKTALLGYVLDPFSISNAKLHKDLERSLKGTGESKLASGTAISAILGLPYLVIAVFPSLITDVADPTLVFLTRVDLFSKYLIILDRPRKEAVEVYGQDKKGLVSKLTFAARVGVPIAGWALIKLKLLDPSLRNNVIIKGISLLPVVVGVASTAGVVVLDYVVYPTIDGMKFVCVYIGLCGDDSNRDIYDHGGLMPPQCRA